MILVSYLVSKRLKSYLHRAFVSASTLTDVAVTDHVLDVSRSRTPAVHLLTFTLKFVVSYILDSFFIYFLSQISWSYSEGLHSKC